MPAQFPATVREPSAPGTRLTEAYVRLMARLAYLWAWSLTLYNQHHFFHPNALRRYSLGTKNKTLRLDADGALTVYIQAAPPGADRESNWLPAPEQEFSLYLRAYGPRAALTAGEWTPPAVTRVGDD